MHRILILLLIITGKATAAYCGQETYYVSEYTGSIYKYPISMTLSEHMGKVSGSYFYLSKKTAIKLEGHVVGKDSFRLIEYGYDKKGKEIKTAILKCRFGETYKLIGTWTDIKSGKTLPLSLKRTHTYVSMVGSYEKKDLNISVQQLVLQDLPNIVAQEKINKELKAIAWQAAYDTIPYKSLYQIAEALGKQLEDPDNPHEDFEYYMNYYNTIEYWDDSILSIGTWDEEYTGGAHPNHRTLYTNFDLNTGKVLQLKDLFKGDFTALQKLVDSVFKTSIGKSPSYKLSEAWYNVDTLYLSANYHISEKGITFYYDFYEIAPYAAGPTEVLIPSELLQSYIRPDGPLAKKLKR